jgi:hypothetical protein
LAFGKWCRGLVVILARRLNLSIVMIKDYFLISCFHFCY